MKRRAMHRLSVEAGDDGDELPTEFRLFVAGWNPTENGDYLFDDEAASAVMSAAAAHGVDRMIDLEHLSLNSESNSFDPDARGWCSLELRSDGSLWAVNVKWTSDGAARLEEKRQRYISPAFEIDPETKRVTKIVNIALTAFPATHKTPELVAARTVRDLRKLSVGLAFSDVQCAIQRALNERFLGSVDPYFCCDGPWVTDVFDASVVYMLDGKLFEVAYTIAGTAVTLADPPVEVQRSYSAVQAPAPAAPEPPKPAAEPAPAAARKVVMRKIVKKAALDSKTVQAALDALESKDSEKCAELLKGLIAAAASGEATPPAPEAETTADKTTDEGDEEEDPAKEEEKQAVVAATARLLRLTSQTTIVAAIDEVETWRASHLTLESEKQKLATERATLEAAERRKLCVELVTIGAEFPATVWADDKSTTLKPRWQKVEIGELRTHVADQRASRGTKQAAVRPATEVATAPAPATSQFQTTNGVVTLSARELAMCGEMKIDPKDYAADKAARKASAA